MTENGRLMHLMPPLPDAAELSVSCRPEQFSASAIARAVEDCNAHLLNMNVTSRRLADDSLVVALRINHRSAAAVGRSLERYGFTVLDSMDLGTDPADEALRLRAAELIHLLEL